MMISERTEFYEKFNKVIINSKFKDYLLKQTEIAWKNIREKQQNFSNSQNELIEIKKEFDKLKYYGSLLNICLLINENDKFKNVDNAKSLEILNNLDALKYSQKIKKCLNFFEVLLFFVINYEFN